MSQVHSLKGMDFETSYQCFNILIDYILVPGYFKIAKLSFIKEFLSISLTIKHVWVLNLKDK